MDYIAWIGNEINYYHGLIDSIDLFYEKSDYISGTSDRLPEDVREEIASMATKEEYQLCATIREHMPANNELLAEVRDTK